MLLALCQLLNVLLSYINVGTEILSYIGGVSLLPILFLYLTSYLFKFCSYHRLFLHYIVVNNIICIYDTYIGVPLSNRQMLCMFLILTGMSLFIILYLYVKSNQKSILKIIDNIDTGNSNLTEEETIKVIETLKSFTDRELRLSKYQACQYLNISRASFDNYVRSGKLPQGLKQAGFKEKFWTKKTLDFFINTYRKK